MLKLKLKQKKSKVFFDGKCSNSFINIIKHSISRCYFPYDGFTTLYSEREERNGVGKRLWHETTILQFTSSQKFWIQFYQHSVNDSQSNQIQIQLYIYSWNGIAEMLLYLFSRNYWNWITKEKKVQRLSAFIIHFA